MEREGVELGNIAIIDTETNWSDKVMSIGTVIADEDTFVCLDRKYHVLTPEYTVGGMYDHWLFPDDIDTVLCTRAEALEQLQQWFRAYRISALYAYNASFDRNHLPELRSFRWYDIMRLAAYRQYNSKIPATAPMFSTGRMKRGYGVEAMLRLLSGRSSYCEPPNALNDAIDELEIMRLLGYHPADYLPL